jgi:predicted GIY-YIG superfamily endonuclease
MECFVYCLATIDEPVKTYVGATTNVDKRLAQHNGLLAGGARATSTRPGAWYRICYVKGFTIWTTALSFEWHWKHYSRKLFKIGKGSPLERRKQALDLTMEWAEKKGLMGLEIVYSE